MGRFRGMIKHNLPRTGGQWGQARGEFRMVDGAAKPAVDAGVRVGHLYISYVTVLQRVTRLRSN